MARLQILELPEGSGDDRPPFVLVVDQVADEESERLVDSQQSIDGVAKAAGARAVAVFHGLTIDLPANAVAGQAEPLMRVADFTSDELRQLAKERDELHAELGLAHGQLHSAALSAIRGKHANIRELIERAKQAEAERDEARQWARHGYEIGQKHCGWTDHGVAPDWLTEGWPPHTDSCEHLKHAVDLEEAQAIRKRVAKEQKATLADALGMDHTRDWDDIRNAAAGLRKQRDDQAAELERLRAGEEPVTDTAMRPTSGQWIWQWNRAAPEKRLNMAAQILGGMAKADDCFMADHEAQIANLRAEVEQLRTERSTAETPDA